MLTSAAKTSRKSLTYHQGFTIIEILVALLIVSLVFLAFPTADSARKHQRLQEVADDLSRAIRFASSEAILRNSVVRLHIDLDKEPQEYSVEYGPKGDLVLPEAQDESKMDLDQIEAAKKRGDVLNGQFTKVEEFEEIARPINIEVTILAMANTYQKKLVKTGQASIYFYPTGERDEALLMLSTDDEMATLSIQAFNEEINVEYAPYIPAGTDPEEAVVENLEQLQQTKVEEIYKAWLRP